MKTVELEEGSAAAAALEIDEPTEFIIGNRRVVAWPSDCVNALQSLFSDMDAIAELNRSLDDIEKGRLVDFDAAKALEEAKALSAQKKAGR